MKLKKKERVSSIGAGACDSLDFLCIVALGRLSSIIPSVGALRELDTSTLKQQEYRNITQLREFHRVSAILFFVLNVI